MRGFPASPRATLHCIKPKNITKVHSFLKQSLYDIHFIKTRYLLSTNLSELAPDKIMISWSTLFSWNKEHCFKNERILVWLANQKVQQPSIAWLGPKVGFERVEGLWITLVLVEPNLPVIALGGHRVQPHFCTSIIKHDLSESSHIGAIAYPRG